MISSISPVENRCYHDLPGYEVGLIRTEQEFHALQPEWARLYEEATPRNPFLSYDWTAGCWANIRKDAVPFILVARWKGRLVGLAALRLKQKSCFRVLGFMADSRSDYLGFLRAPDHPQASVALLDHLNNLRSSWDVTILRRLCGAYTDINSMIIPPGLCSVVLVVGPVAPYLSFPGDWDELCALGPSQLRHTRRPARKFERDGGTIKRVDACEALDMIDEIAEVESHSWKARRGNPWLSSGPNQRLLRQALSTLGERNEMEVWLARLAGRLVAYLINFVTPERVMFYQGAYHEAYGKYYAGGVLHFHAIRNAWQSGLREYDFLIGKENYKEGWTTAEHSQQHLSLFPNTLRGRLAFKTLVAPRWHLRSFRSAHVVYDFAFQLRDRLRGRLHHP